LKKYIHLFIAFSLIASSVGLIVFWETYLDDTINTISVVVAAKNLEKNHVINASDVKIEKVKIEHAVEKPIINTRDIIGKETAQYIPKGNQIVSEMVDYYGLEPNKNQLIYPIPREWIYSSPGSLRRKDRVFVYPIPDDRLIHRNNQQTPLIVHAASEPILKEIVVAFAKDSANQEVKPASNSDKRIDATGSINNLELVMTEEQYNVLETAFLKGFKFNFAYK